MKKITTLLLTLIICSIPLTSTFANEISDEEFNFTEVPLEATLDTNARNSVTGLGGTAYIGSMNNGNTLIWRITSTKGPILSFAGTISITDTKGKHIKTLYVSGGGPISITKQVAVGSGVKKGSTYKATFNGSGVSGKYEISVANGCVHHFTVR